MVVAAGIEGTPPISIADVAADADDVGMSRRGVGTQAPGYGPAVHSRHRHVQQHDVRLVGGRYGEGGTPIPRGPGIVAREADQKSDRFAGILVVVDGQYAELADGGEEVHALA